MEFPTPTPHQLRESEYLARPDPDNKRVTRANYGGMGSGKTLTTLMAMARIREAAPGEVHIVVCPPIATTMWLEQAAAYLDVYAQALSTKTRIDPDAGVLVLTYAIATKRSAELRMLNVGVLVLDEGHACKDVTSQRTIALLGNDGVAVKARYTFVLTGTPKPRWNDDLYPFLCHAKPKELALLAGDLSLRRFRLRYCITQRKRFHPNQQFPKIVTVGNRNTAELSDLLYDGEYPAAVRTELEEAFANMPPLTINTLKVELKGDSSFRQHLAEFEGQPITVIQEKLRSQEPALTEMRHLIGDAKVHHTLKEIISRLEAGVRPILIGAWHRSVIAALMDGLKKYSIGEISGRTSSTSNQIMKRRFMDGKLDVLVGQISAMGTALDGLQKAGNYIICIEQDWSPDLMDQFYARLRRGGQTRHVHVDIFDGGTKVEEAMSNIAGRKASESVKLHRSA